MFQLNANDHFAHVSESFHDSINLINITHETLREHIILIANFTFFITTITDFARADSIKTKNTFTIIKIETFKQQTNKKTNVSLRYIAR